MLPDLICRARYHRRRKDLVGIQRGTLRLLMNRLRLLAMWLSIDSAPITTAESLRWKSAQMSIWAAEAGFSPSKRPGRKRSQLFIQKHAPFWQTMDTVGTAWRTSSGVKGDGSGML